MKIKNFLMLLCALVPACAAAQDRPTSIEDRLATTEKILQQMQTQHQQEIDALKQQITTQQKVIDELKETVARGTEPPLPAPGGEPNGSLMAGLSPNTTAQSAPAFPVTDESVVSNTAPAAASPRPAEIPTTDASILAIPFSGTGPITIAGGKGAYMNISFDAAFTFAASTAQDLDRIEVGDHDPQQRGFNARNLELALDGAVDPYFEAFANIVFKLDNFDETDVEFEEAFAQTTSLPFGLQVKAGQFFAPMGRINPMHPHTWDFVDAPLVNGRLLGPDGLRGLGAQISWMTPLPWYSHLLLAVQNGQGGTAYSFRNPGEEGTFFGRETIDRQLHGLQNLLFVPRWENSFELAPNHTLLLGASAAIGPNATGNNSNTQIYGIDAFYKWKPANAGGGWPFVKWQSEAMLRRYEAGRGLDDSFPVTETFTDWGAYSQVVWGFKKGWTAGLRGDYIHFADSAFTADSDRQTRWRLSADLTWFPSEFSKLRLQFNHDTLEAMRFQDSRNVESVFLQFEFALGAHRAHSF